MITEPFTPDDEASTPVMTARDWSNLAAQPGVRRLWRRRHIAPLAAWDAADLAARSVERAINPTLNRAGRCAIRAAYQSTGLIDTRHPAALDAMTGIAALAHALATGGTPATRVVELTRHAIRAWHRLARFYDTTRRHPGTGCPATHDSAPMAGMARPHVDSEMLTMAR